MVNCCFQNLLAFSHNPPYNILIFFDLFFGTSSTLLEILLVDGGFNQKRNVILKIKAQKANSSLFAFFVPFFPPEWERKEKNEYCNILSALPV